MTRRIMPVGGHLGAFSSEVLTKWGKKNVEPSVLSRAELTWLAEIAFRPVDLSEIEPTRRRDGSMGFKRGSRVSASHAERLARLFVMAPEECLKFLVFARNERNRKLRSKEWIARAAARWWSFVAQMERKDGVDAVAAQKDLERRLRENGFSEREIGNSQALLHRALSQLRRHPEPRI